MKRQRTSYAFLTEMMFVCVFFLISSCIFVLAFAKAEHMSREAETLNQAVAAVSNAMETTFASCSGGDLNPELFPEQQNGRSDAFTVQVETEENQGLLHVTVRAVDKNGAVLYSLEGARCLSGAGSSGSENFGAGSLGAEGSGT